jgi:hypothetical protein
MGKRTRTAETYDDDNLKYPIIVHDVTPCVDKELPAIWQCTTKKEQEFFAELSRLCIEKVETSTIRSTSDTSITQQEIQEQRLNDHYKHLESYFEALKTGKTEFIDGKYQKVFTDENRILKPPRYKDDYYDICDTCREFVPTKQQNGKTDMYFPTIKQTSMKEQNGNMNVCYFIFPYFV